MDRIPLARPDLGGNEEAYVVEAIRSSWISSMGPFVDRFEAEFAEMCGAKHAVATANGTVALHLALLALDVRPGDEVIVPSLTYVATANAVRYVGAEPVFVDVDPATWCIDPAALEAAFTPRTRGVIPVHLYGHPADMDAVNDFAAVRGLWVLEDAAEAHFAKYKGRIAGSLGRMATFSFFGNKMFTCGEGGAITLDDGATATRLRTLRGHGADPKRRYFFPVTGYNFRLTNVACAMLCAQLERRDAILERRRAIFASYGERLRNVPGIEVQPVARWAEPARWLFCITVDEAAYGMGRDALMALLGDQGIETRPFFIPLHTLPPFREGSRRRGEQLPHTERLAAVGLNLPTFNDVTDAQIARVCDVIARGRRGLPIALRYSTLSKDTLAMPLNESQRSQLESLVTSKPIVLFMKGSRHFPQCGFSSQVIAVLNELVPSYETVNVLADAGVREGVKELTGWPTIPQLFIGGEFVGGCDIVKSLHASGELTALLRAKGIETKDRAGKPATSSAAPSITLTPAAARAFEQALADSPDDRLRFAISPRFEYDLSIGPPQADDVVVQTGTLAIHVEADSAARAGGTVIDFLDGPDGGFKIDNRNGPARVQQLAPAELKAMLDRGVPMALFDVRTDGERAIAKLATARIFDAAAQADIEAMPKDAMLVFHCHHGSRSQAAAERYIAQGYTNVYNVAGGIDAWSLAIDPSLPRY